MYSIDIRPVVFSLTTLNSNVKQRYHSNILTLVIDFLEGISDIVKVFENVSGSLAVFSFKLSNLNAICIIKIPSE